MASLKREQMASSDELQTRALYASSETDSLFSAPMDQDSEQIPMSTTSILNGQHQDEAQQPPVKGLTENGQEAPEQPSRTGEIFRLYATLYECYNKTVGELRRIEEENYMLRSANIQLCHQLQASDRRIADHAAMLAFSEQGFENFRHGIKAVIEAWEINYPKAKP